jgi:hypothetical protein
VSAPLDISDPLRELCDILELEYSNVAQLELKIEPNSVIATVYRVNEHGFKYIDLSTGKGASDTLIFQVTT